MKNIFLIIFALILPNQVQAESGTFQDGYLAGLEYGRLSCFTGGIIYGQAYLYEKDRGKSDNQADLLALEEAGKIDNLDLWCPNTRELSEMNPSGNYQAGMIQGLKSARESCTLPGISYGMSSYRAGKAGMSDSEIKSYAYNFTKSQDYGNSDWCPIIEDFKN